jgi:hypothetical protein
MTKFGKCRIDQSGLEDSTESNKLWPTIMTTPHVVTGEAGSQTSAESTIIAQPSAHKTMSIVTW